MVKHCDCLAWDAHLENALERTKSEKQKNPDELKESIRIAEVGTVSKQTNNLLSASSKVEILSVADKKIKYYMFSATSPLEICNSGWNEDPFMPGGSNISSQHASRMDQAIPYGGTTP